MTWISTAPPFSSREGIVRTRIVPLPPIASAAFATRLITAREICSRSRITFGRPSASAGAVAWHRNPVIEIPVRQLPRTVGERIDRRRVAPGEHVRGDEAAEDQDRGEAEEAEKQVPSRRRAGVAAELHEVCGPPSRLRL